MTLIINAATPGFIVHASDRRLTKRVGSSVRVHSDVENKSLIVLIHDAICIVGYTGAAYIGDTITDEWIASTITGLDLSGDFMMRQPGVRRLTLNQLLRRIEAAMRAVVLPASANYLGITVSGVRRRRHYSRFFVREFERNRGVVRAGGHMRSPRSPHFHLLSQIGDHGPLKELPLTIGKEFEQHGISAEAFRRGMINAIRERSKQAKTVGDEIMTITVRSTPDGWDIVWIFESPRPHFHRAIGGAADRSDSPPPVPNQGNDERLGHGNRGRFGRIANWHDGDHRQPAGRNCAHDRRANPVLHFPADRPLKAECPTDTDHPGN